MRYVAALLLLVVALGTSSCTHKASKSSPITGDYMIIGRAGGFIGPGAFSDYYLISGGQLKEDTTVVTTLPPADISGFNFNITLPASKYNSVSHLMGAIPSELLSQNNAHIGGVFPDMGYTDVRTVINGTPYRWYFEGDQSTNSIAIQQFYDSLQVVFR